MPYTAAHPDTRVDASEHQPLIPHETHPETMVLWKAISSILLSRSHTLKPIEHKNQDTEILAGTALGLLGNYIYENIGAETALHEVVGHGLLGMRLTSSYPEGTGPSYWISGFDKYNAINNAHSSSKKVGSFLSWLFIPQSSQDGAVGRANRGPDYHPNELAKHMGVAGSSAWISITGSLPGLLVNGACVTGGMVLRKTCPTLGAGLVSFGLMNNLISCTYAWDAAIMSTSELKEAAQTGHDFANFANQMSLITGVSATAIAISTAVFWTSAVPLLGLGIYLYQRSHQADIIPDDIAIKYWLTQLQIDQKKQSVFKTLFKNYPHRDKLPFKFDDETSFVIFDSSKLTDDRKNIIVIHHFINYLATHLPAKMMRQTKEALLKQWQPLQHPSRLEKILAYATLAHVILGVATQIINVLAQTIVPNLLPVSDALKWMMPFLGLFSVLKSAYETYKDLKCPTAQIPLAAKLLSCAKLILNIAITTLMLVNTFVPGFQLFLIPTVMLSSLLLMVMNFAKVKLIKNQFKKNHDEETSEATNQSQHNLGFFNQATRTDKTNPSTQVTHDLDINAESLVAC